MEYTTLNVEAARLMFLTRKRDQLMEVALPQLMQEACATHPTKVGIALKMVLDCPTGQVRQMEACLSLDELLRDAAMDLAEEEWRKIAKVLPLREAA